MYYSILMLKPNEMGPNSNEATLLVSIIMIIDLFVAANIYGNVAGLVQVLDRRSREI